MLIDDEKEINPEQEEVTTPAEETVEVVAETVEAVEAAAPEIEVAAEEAVEVVAETSETVVAEAETVAPAMEAAAEETVEAVAEEAHTIEAAVEETVETAVETVEVAPEVADVPVPVVAAEEVAPVVADEPVPVVAAEEVAPKVADEPMPVVETVIEAVAPAIEVEETPAPAKTIEAAEITDDEEEEVELPVFDPIQAGGAHDDFNWTIDKRGTLIYSEAEHAAMLREYDATLSNVVENEIIKGRVSAISGGDVVLDINYKSDGLISLNEFRDIPGLAQGDYVEVYVESQEDSQGQLGLSRRKAKILRAWESIVDSFKNGTIIRGSVISKTKGGLIVDCNGLETFLPGSQIDIKPVVDYDQYVGKMMEFKVVKVNEQIKNAVVSHKALIESDLAEQREQILGSLEKGQVLEGIVKNITDFGAFLDLGGVDGLLYITDISWGRIGHPSEVLSLNQRINVVVLDFDENKKRISLGLKQLTPHPWDVLASEVGEGSIVKGKIVNIEDYGAFVEIQPGVEGLIHVSEITWGNQSVHAKEFFKLGQEIEARVVTVDRGDRKMSLSVKQLTSDPWSDIEERFPVGTRFTGTVKNITNYGIFVELTEGVGGMVHISDLSWTKRYAHPSEFAKPGSELEVIVLDIDKEKRQISLGHKQIQENPWDAFEAIFPVGSYHEATVLKRDDKGATFQMPHGLEAFGPAKHIRKEDGNQADVNDVLTVKVIEFNKDERRLLVSHTRYLEDLKYKAEAVVKAERAKEDGENQSAIVEVQKKVEKETLGDLASLAALKDQLEK
jgi:small subunit ribosomal protein S1